MLVREGSQIRVVESKETKNEFLGFSRAEKESKVITDILVFLDKSLSTLDRTSDKDSIDTKEKGKIEYWWRFKIGEYEKSKTDALIKYLNSFFDLINNIAGKSKKADFSVCKDSSGKYYDGDIYLYVDFPKLPENTSEKEDAYKYLNVQCYFKRGRRDSEIIYGLELFIRDFDTLKKYIDKASKKLNKLKK